MYSKAERQKAVDLYIKYEKRAATVIRELGYPNRHTLKNWYKEFKEEGKLREGRKKRERYSISRDYDDSQVRAAVNHFLAHGRSYSWTVKDLGYPSMTTLKRWVKLVAPDARPSRLSSDFHRSYTDEAKDRAVAAYCAEPDKPVSQIAEEHGVSRLSIYAHKQKLERKGYNVPAMGRRKKKQEASPFPPMGEPETEKEAELMAKLAEARYPRTPRS